MYTRRYQIHSIYLHGARARSLCVYNKPNGKVLNWIITRVCTKKNQMFKQELLAWGCRRRRHRHFRFTPARPEKKHENTGHVNFNSVHHLKGYTSIICGIRNNLGDKFTFAVTLHLHLHTYSKLILYPITLSGYTHTTNIYGALTRNIHKI